MGAVTQISLCDFVPLREPSFLFTILLRVRDKTGVGKESGKPRAGRSGRPFGRSPHPGPPPEGGGDCLRCTRRRGLSAVNCSICRSPSRSASRKPAAIRGIVAAEPTKWALVGRAGGAVLADVHALAGDRISPRPQPGRTDRVGHHDRPLRSDQGEIVAQGRVRDVDAVGDETEGQLLPQAERVG